MDINASAEDIRPRDLLEPAELAALLHVSTKTLRNWRSLRKGPTPTKFGSKARYLGQDVIDWIEAERKRQAREWMAS